MNEVYKNIKKVIKEKGLDAFIISNPISKRYLLGNDDITNYIVVTKNRIYIFKPFDKYKEDYSNNYYNNNNFTEFILYKRNELKIELNKVIKKENLKIVGFESNHLTYSNWLKLKFYFGKDIMLVPCDYLIEDLRAIKTSREIQIIKEASALTEQLLNGFFVNKIPYGTTEIDLEKNFEKYIFKNNIERLPFRFEVSAGKKTSLVNSTPSNNVIKPGDLLLIDFGIEYKGYVTDIARTFVIEKATENQRLLYTAVKIFLDTLIQRIKPNDYIGDIVDFVDNYYKRLGMKYKLPYDIGHGIGLEFHERPYISRYYNEKIKEGMILCLEPGIYLESGGVRLEDMILITKKGAEFLTRSSNTLPIIYLERR